MAFVVRSPVSSGFLFNNKNAIYIFFILFLFFYFHDHLKLGLWIMEQGRLGEWKKAKEEIEEDLHSLEGRRIISNVV